MPMKKPWILLVCLCALPLAAEVSVLTVTDEDKHSRKEDFFHTFEYFILSSDKQQESGKCQATRITSNWFVTAAHCVERRCQKACTLQLDLLEGPMSVLATTQHTAKKPTVFIHPQYKPYGKEIQIQHDLALIYLDINRAPKTYYQRANATQKANMIIPSKIFFAWLEQHPKAKSNLKHALFPSLPPIAVFDEMNQELDRKISVISIFDGVRRVKPDPHKVYYIKDLGYAYTQNFGIRKGMSGSGVVTNTGELIGIISSTVTRSSYPIRGNATKGKAIRENLFMFPVFNADSVNFMKEVMGKDFDKISQKDAYPYLAKKTSKNFHSLVSMMTSPNFNWH